MAEPKTKKNDLSVEDFLNSVSDETRRADGLELLKLYKKVTKEEPKMWGTAIVGFGEYNSGTGTWPLAGFSPRKQNLTLYVMHETLDLSDLLAKLGKNSTSKACLYINKLSDVNLDVLEQIVERSFNAMKKLYNAE